MRDLRIATVVCKAEVGNIEANLGRAAAFAEKARQEGADIICFPELNLTGYINHPAIVDLAQPIPGALSRKVLDLAASSGLAILAGMAEKKIDGRVYASHLVALPEGDLAVYRKLHIAPPEKAIYSPGNHVPLFRFEGFRFGIQLCYDAHFPELSTHMALEGAEILFMPHASPRGMSVEKHNSWLRHLTARAFDNSVFVVACNQTGPNGGGLFFPGNAVVIDPAGRVLAQRLSGREGILFTDLKADDLNRVRNNPMHFFLPHRRGDLYPSNPSGKPAAKP